MDKVGNFLLTNHRNAGIVAFLLTLLPLIGLPGGFIAAVLVAFITLMRGVKAGLINLGWIALPAIGLLILHRKFGVFDILLVRAGLVWLFAVVLLTYQSWRLVLELAAILGALGVVIVYLIYPDIQAFWVAHLTNYVKELQQAATFEFSKENSQQLIKQLAPIATGILVFLTSVFTVVQLLLARFYQRMYQNKIEQFRVEFTNIHLGRLITTIFTVVLIAALLKLHLAVDVLPALMCPFMFAGLSLLHFFSLKYRHLLLLVILVYLGLIFVSMIVIMLLVLVGYIDSYYDFRWRVSRR